MIGDKLMPLNVMEGEYSTLHQQYLKKYVGRERILKRTIPLLDCLWNDVVQFLPLHPRKVFELQVEMGIIPEVQPYTFYEIDISVLDPEKTVIFFKTAPGEKQVVVRWLKDVDWESLQAIPQETKDYYKTCVTSGELPFNYQFVPHILYKGTVDVSQANIITL